VSGGRDKDCVKGDRSFNVDVFQFRDWIVKAGSGQLSSQACAIPGGETRNVQQAVVRLDGTKPAARFHVSVRQRRPRCEWP